MCVVCVGGMQLSVCVGGVRLSVRLDRCVSDCDYHVWVCCLVNMVRGGKLTLCVFSIL